MTTLAWWLIRAQFRTRRAATLLSMLAIALGVALGYAIHLINDAALADFARAMQTVQGDPDALLAARNSAGSVPLETINDIARDPAVLVIAPVIETRVRIEPARTPVRLIGLDVFSAAAVMPKLLPRQSDRIAGSLFDGGVYVSPALLGQLGLPAGAAVTLRRGDQHWATTIAGDLPGTGPDDLRGVAGRVLGRGRPDQGRGCRQDRSVGEADVSGQGDREADREAHARRRRRTDPGVDHGPQEQHREQAL